MGMRIHMWCLRWQYKSKSLVLCILKGFIVHACVSQYIMFLYNPPMTIWDLTRSCFDEPVKQTNLRLLSAEALGCVDWRKATTKPDITMFSCNTWLGILISAYSPPENLIWKNLIHSVLTLLSRDMMYIFQKHHQLNTVFLVKHLFHLSFTLI